MIFRWRKLPYHNKDCALGANKTVSDSTPRGTPARADSSPDRRNCFGIPNMFQRLRFVTRATSTPVFPSTLNRQR